jgi:hypothetical protein
MRTGSSIQLPRRMRNIILIGWLVLLTGGICALFWYYDWQYKLPTPVPAGYNPVALNTRIDGVAGIEQEKGKPLFLHFFNPACPCSRFNFRHFKWLADKYGDRVDFKIVLMSSKRYTEQEIQDKFDTRLPVVSDSSVAAACGVYATPQAVIIDEGQQLYYRGNYNSSRYCTDAKTEYARIALDSLLDKKNIHFNSSALTAYGCKLPKCTR